jgi:hypothetical protein
MVRTLNQANNRNIRVNAGLAESGSIGLPYRSDHIILSKLCQGSNPIKKIKTKHMNAQKPVTNFK